MRFVLLSDRECRGGANVAAGRLAAGLVARGHEVHWVSPRPDDGRHPWHSVPFELSLLTRAAHGLCQRSSSALASRLRGSMVRRSLRAVLEDLAPDVVNLHNVHGARWSVDVLGAVPASALPVWTLHDMWTLTGRCAYAFDCRQYTTACTATCPTPSEYPALAASQIPAAYAERRSVLQTRPDAIAVAPSRWLAREAVGGMWQRHRVAHIPNGVPSGEYFPEPQAAAREALGLGPNHRVAVVVAERLGERRKGWPLLQAALERIKDPALHLLLVGDVVAECNVPAPHRVRLLGRVAQAEGLRQVFCAADLLVHPAPVDNLPNVVLEAMACGVPTVAFPVGGLPDMVRPGISGWLAKSLSAEALAVALVEAFSSEPGRQLEVTCREMAVREYTPDLQARRYEALVAGASGDLLSPEAVA
jgi:glycosyltransferase involved in cell wall biosynthesis